MKVVKKTAEYTVYQKRNNRYGVKSSNKQWINGEDKVKILLAEDLIKVTAPSAPAEEPSASNEESSAPNEETTDDETAETVEDSAEAPEEASTDENEEN